MNKILKYVFLSIVIISLSACFDNNKKTNADYNNIENYLQSNTQESYEDIVSNTVQYGNNEEVNQEKEEEIKNETIISCQDCFHNIGFVEKKCEQNGKYFFERKKNENDEYDIFDWYVYIFDEKQKYKEIQENNQPVLTNEGEIEIKRDQYIYILCSYNPETEVLPANSDQEYIYYMR